MERLIINSGEHSQFHANKLDKNALALIYSITKSGTGLLPEPCQEFRFIICDGLDDMALFSLWKDREPILISFIALSAKGRLLVQPVVGQTYARITHGAVAARGLETQDLILPSSMPFIITIRCPFYNQTTDEERKFFEEFEESVAYSIISKKNS